MKASRLAFTASFAILVFAIPGNSCGPFFPEAVFVQNTMPDGPYAAYAAGQIGVPQPGYRVQDLVVAYDWLNGHGLSTSEQQQAVALDRISNSHDFDDPAKRPGFVAWLAARKDSGVPSSTPSAPDSVTGDLVNYENRPVPGESYQSFTNCLDPAFATAAATLNAQKTAHAEDTSNFADWIQGQDAVFANCNGSGDKMPADASVSAPEWLKQDRAYQQAAAKFYQTDYDDAIVRLKMIAADTSSPWHAIARLVAARAMIRRATIGQITELPPAAIARPDAPYSEDREKAQRAYAQFVKQKEPARLAEARDALQAIVAEPSMQPYHADASDTAQPASPNNPNSVPATFFGTQPAGRTALTDPPFLTGANRAAADREIAELRATPCSSDYFAAAALDWQKQHPTDPRTPDILGFAERAVRNGCRTKATPDLNRRLFVVVQTQYPKSEWAKRYTSWE